ncbi:hypothetical protein HYT01_03100, partial [Candidatus Giovannonibacteria bacterium]|nr:hypothetical protein [Candidatus Giovannonibacteria bacterium]
MILRNGSYSSNPVGNNTIRRNYINWRNYPNSSNGSTCLGTYPSQGNVFENNITEGANGCDTSFTPLLVGGANSSGNSFYGNISIGHNISFQTGVGSSGGPTTSDDVTFENNIAISSEATHSPAGGYGRRITHRNYSAFADSAIRTDAFVEGFEVGYDSRMLRIADPSAECTNCLLYGAWPAGFYIDTNEVPNFKLDFPAVYNVGTPFSPDASDPRITNEIALTSAELGSCKAYIPDSATSLKGKGKNGADIGANILYVYENGVLTNKPLWNPQTGEFPHGAIVPRLNDIPGQSLFNIHQRLNVNTNGCPFPQGYGGSWPPGEAVAEGGPAGTVAFHILDSSQAVPTGFGASYNVLSSAQELLLKANCT